MTEKEIATFTDAMDTRGDEWTEEQVRRVYGECTLDEAKTDRNWALDMFYGNLQTISAAGYDLDKILKEGTNE